MQRAAHLFMSAGGGIATLVLVVIIGIVGVGVTALAPAARAVIRGA